jgi:hypothetical protein
LPEDHPRRPALRYNKEMAEQYGINPDIPDPPRETVKVDHLPDPPEVQATGTARPAQAHVNLEETVINILKEELEELSVRLDRFGVALTPSMQQDMLDHAMALLGGFVGGGAIGRR